jgi:amino acid permease
VSSAAGFVYFWDTEQRYAVLWMFIFFIAPILFNFLYVRWLGEIEYWFTTIKIIFLLVLIVSGVLIAMGLSTDPLLGTSAQYTPVPCSANVIGECVPGPGLGSLLPLSEQH